MAQIGEEAKDDREVDIDEKICTENSIGSKILANYLYIAPPIQNIQGVMQPPLALQAINMAHVPVPGINQAPPAA